MQLGQTLVASPHKICCLVAQVGCLPGLAQARITYLWEQETSILIATYRSSNLSRFLSVTRNTQQSDCFFPLEIFFLSPPPPKKNHPFQH